MGLLHAQTLIRKQNVTFMISHCIRNKMQIPSSGLQVWCDPAPADSSTSSSSHTIPSLLWASVPAIPLSPYFCRVSSFPSQLRYHLLREVLLEHPS